MSKKTLCYECYFMGSHYPYYTLECKKAGHKPKEQKNILVLCNGMEHHEFLTLITDMIRELTDNQLYNYRFIFRMHPNIQYTTRLTKEYLDKLQNSFLNKHFLIFDNTTDLYEQINNANLIIGGETTCTYESIALNNNTIHYKIEGALGHIDDTAIMTYTDFSSLYDKIIKELEE